MLLTYSVNFGDVENMPEALYYAIIFHDAVYIPKFIYNEQASAELFPVLWYTVLGVTVDPVLALEVKRLIGYTTIATYMSGGVEDYLGKILSDLDLCALSLPYPEFVKKQVEVAKEFYPFGGVKEIDRAQASFLSSLVESRKGVIYTTHQMANLNEIAVANVAAYKNTLNTTIGGY